MTQQIAGYCTLCRSRCGSLNTVEDGRLVDVQPLPGHPSGGALCAKGRAAPEIVGSPRRITTPLRRTQPRGSADPGWEEVSWDEALTDIAGRLQQVKQESGAEAVAFASTTPSGTPIVDSVEWIERLVRRFGSPNLVYAVEICGWHKDYAHALTFGRGAGAPDYDEAETIILWGHNPARTWLAQASRIAEARARGAKVVVIDPKKAGSGQQSDLWLRVRPGTDAALALGGIRHLLHTQSYDTGFVRSWTNAPMLVADATGHFVRAEDVWEDAVPGAFVVCDDAGPRAYDPAAELERPADVHLGGSFTLTTRAGETVTARPALTLLEAHCARWTIDEVARATTIDEPSVRAFYELLSTEKKVAYHSWTGVGQHSNATQTERSIAALYAILGACDRPGGNLWLQPPSVNPLSPYADLPQEQQAKALGLKELPLGPPRLGWVTARHFCRAVLEADPYQVRALMSFGNNMMVSQADGDRTKRALEALDLYVHVDMFLNPTAEMADYVLPANTPWERDALRVGFEITQEAVEYIQFRPQMLPSLGDTKPDYEIAIALAEKLGLADEFFGGDVRAGWNWHLEPTGVTVEGLAAGKKYARVPQEASREKYARRTGDCGTVEGFATPTKRVELYSQQLLEHGYRPLPSFIEPIATGRKGGATGVPLPLVLSTHKNGVYVHTSHRHVASLRRRAPDPHFDVSPQLAEERGLVEGDWAVLETETGTTRARVRLDEDLHPAVVMADFGWWEDCPPLGLPRTPVSGDGTLNINAVLSDDEHDPTSGSVPLRAVACELRKDELGSRGNWSGQQEVEVARTWTESDSVLGLTIVPVSGALEEGFRPGQHVLLAPSEDSPARAYSVTRGGSREDSFDIAVRRVPEGVVSGFIHDDVSAGDRLWLEKPQGTFTPPLTGDRPVVLIAGGVGITPFIGYLRTLREVVDRPPTVTLLQVFRNAREHPFREEMEALKKALPELSTVTWYSQPLAEDTEGVDYDIAGRPSLSGIDGSTSLLSVQDRPLIYLCGAGGLMDQMTDEALAQGVPKFDVFREDFQSTVEVPPNLEPAEIQLADGSAVTWEPSDGTILNAAERHGHRLPSGCRVGQCESCAVRVLKGSIAHLGEAPADDVCLTCIAVPIGNVTLDV